MALTRKSQHDRPSSDSITPNKYRTRLTFSKALMMAACCILGTAATCHGQTVRGVELGATTAEDLVRRRGAPSKAIRRTESGRHRLYEYGEYTFYVNTKTGIVEFVRWFPSTYTSRQSAEQVYGSAQRIEADLDLTRTAVYNDTLVAKYRDDELLYTEVLLRPRYDGLSAESLRSRFLLRTALRCMSAQRPDETIVDSIASDAIPVSAGLWAYDTLRARIAPYREILARNDSAAVCRIVREESLKNRTPPRRTKSDSPRP